MKEHPILFSGPMIRAIQKNRKTVTRRPIKRQPEKPIDKWVFCGNDYLGRPLYSPGTIKMGMHSWAIPCPYGAPGDRLWVRETHLIVGGSDSQNPRVVYRATNDGPDAWGSAVWRPSIFMPRWACRIILENVNVRVERVQDITEAEALREGILFKSFPISSGGGYRRTFEAGWDEMYSKKPELQWEVNPWVWRVEFKRVTS